jgi:radical SAM superfamily enzyme YgiQ (UPF0313 family)
MKPQLKVLLVWPETAKGLAAQMYEYTLRITGMKAAIPPTGLCTIAAYLPESWPLRLVDMNVEKLRDEDVAWADVVFLSAIVNQERSLVETARRVKALGKRVVVGGSFVNSSGERLAGTDCFDALCVGEGEAYVHQLVADLEQGTLRPRYGEGVRPSFEEIDHRPPRYDLLGKRQRLRYATIALETSRGCPFNCEFCDIVSVFGRKMRYKLPAQVIAELESLKRLGWKGQIALVDDNLIGNGAKARELLGAITEWQQRNGYPFYFNANLSLNLADDDEAIEVLFRAGVRYVFVGVESPNPDSLREIGKKVNLSGDMVPRIHKLIRAGFDLDYGMIVGFDHDREDTFGAISRFVEESNVPNALFQILQVLDNTRLHTRMKEEGRLLADAGHQLVSNGRTNFVTRIPAADLQAGYAGVLGEIYDPATYYRRVARLVLMLGERHVENMHFYRPRFDFLNVMTVVLNLLFGIERRHFAGESLRVLRRGGWWRFFKYHQYIQQGFSYLAFYRKIIANIRAHPLPRGRPPSEAPALEGAMGASQG